MDPLDQRLREIKADLHRHPELSFHEERTTKKIREYLEDLDIDIVDLGLPTGVIGLLRGAGEGPTVGLRADIDAIAQQEAPHEGPMSENDGVMHACGHDFHTTGLLGAVKLLADQRDRIDGNIVFVFQPAEEITQGAGRLVEHGLIEKTGMEMIFGVHNRPEIDAGEIAVVEGPLMAGKTHFKIRLHGKSGHGGSPHKCADVIVCAAQIVSTVQTIVSRSIDPLDSLVCSVLSIHAGTEENFVPDELTMTGSIRYLRKTSMEKACERLKDIAELTAKACLCQAEVTFIPDVPVTDNSAGMTKIAQQAAEKVVGAEKIVRPKPDMGSEDFAVYGESIPNFFYWVGSGVPGEANPCWHNEHFRTDDDALIVCSKLYAQSALEALDAIRNGSFSQA